MPPHWRALVVLTAARTSLGFQFQSLAAVSPQLVGDLGLSYADLGTLIGLYFLPGLVFALPGGALGQRFGDRRIVVLGLVLMVIGGVLTCLAEGFAPLLLGRLVAGTGAVLLNVLMSKMVTDWFAGRREIVLAMAIFVNSFPIGVGMAVLALTPVAAHAGWAVALAAAPALCLVALLLMGTAYAPHANEGGEHDGAAEAAPLWARLSPPEFVLVSIAGAIWGIFNGAFSLMFGFAPIFLAAAGVPPAEASLVAGSATWLVALSGQLGGLLAQRWVRPWPLMLIGAIGWSFCLVLLAAGAGTQGAALIAAGLLMGLPIGVIMSLPAQVLRPENRALGMGLFYLWLYAGQGGVPPLAGWLQDTTGSAAAPMLLAATLVISMVPLYGAFRLGLAAEPRFAELTAQPNRGAS